MKVINGIGEIDERLARPVLTVGNFDGVHIGHGHVIGLVVERARKIEGTSVVMTFDPHSRVFFDPDSHEPMITTLEQRLELIESLGPEAVIIQRFDERFASMDADDFVVKLLVEQLGIAELFVSAKFTFGRGAAGNVALLERAAGEHGFKLNVVENVHFRHSLVSSSFIRRAVLNGEMELAMRMLGRPYAISGVVYADTQRGTDLLSCPTSNIRPENELIPINGIYVGAAKIGDDRFPTATYIGTRPTFEGEKLVIEAHLLGYSGSLYGRVISLEFFKKIRDDKKFPTPAHLQAQIDRDIAEVMAYFKRRKDEPTVKTLNWPGAER